MMNPLAESASAAISLQHIAPPLRSQVVLAMATELKEQWSRIYPNSEGYQIDSAVVSRDKQWGPPAIGYGCRVRMSFLWGLEGQILPLSADYESVRPNIILVSLIHDTLMVIATAFGVCAASAATLAYFCNPWKAMVVAQNPKLLVIGWVVVALASGLFSLGLMHLVLYPFARIQADTIEQSHERQRAAQLLDEVLGTPHEYVANVKAREDNSPVQFIS